MSLLRQIALAFVLLAGTALAVTAYLDTQHGSLHGGGEIGAPTLEFRSSYPMSRPVRAISRPLARESRQPASIPAAQVIRREGGGGVSCMDEIKPIPASFSEEEELDGGPASAARLPLTN